MQVEPNLYTHIHKKSMQSSVSKSRLQIISTFSPAKYSNDNHIHVPHFIFLYFSTTLQFQYSFLFCVSFDTRTQATWFCHVSFEAKTWASCSVLSCFFITMSNWPACLTSTSAYELVFLYIWWKQQQMENLMFQEVLKMLKIINPKKNIKETNLDRAKKKKKKLWKLELKHRMCINSSCASGKTQTFSWMPN